ncbi:ABC transporter permease [Sphaerisporangium corydalis]|uniref:ABC transporter permease n=1 Tax=Sphaerisporangium corydalis TaxID=1441875 RepID=A0ABV9EE02_9ACTN|nr:ABC transporter permease [Sphaerisporangium corydalis]
MSTLTGTGGLVRLILRRDRALMPVWVVIPCLIPVAFVSAFDAGYPTAQARAAYAATSVHNAAFTVTYGPLSGSGLGELVTWRAGFIPVVVALAAVLMVVRHTRAEEEAGRRELIGATAVGRHAGLAAALAATCGAALVLGLLSALALTGAGLPATGSLAYGLGLAAAGWVFAGVGAVAAQLTSGAGGARGAGITVLVAAFLLRGAGDVSARSGGGLGGLSWLSPIGWAHRMRPFAGERWWVLGLAACAVAALTASAAALSARRDLGGGLFQARLGPATAAPGLRTPLALAWRLHRGPLLARAAGFTVLGLVLGGIAQSVGELLDGGSPAARDALARLGGRGALADQYLTAMMTLLGLVAAGYAVQAVLRLRAEESGGRAEPLLAAPVGRLRWAGGHLAFGLLGPAAGLVLAGAAAGLAHGMNTGHVGRELPRLLGAALAELPAVWVFAGLAFALAGLLPRLAAGAFAVLAASLLLGWVGAELRLGGWVTGLSVFAHVPPLPGGDLSVPPLAVLTALAAALTGLGLLGLRHRDLPVG